MVQILCPQLQEQLLQVSGSGISPCLRSHSRGSPRTSFLCHSTVENTTNAYQYFKMCLSFPDMVLSHGAKMHVYLLSLMGCFLTS